MLCGWCEWLVFVESLKSVLVEAPLMFWLAGHAMAGLDETFELNQLGIQVNSLFIARKHWLRQENLRLSTAVGRQIKTAIRVLLPEWVCHVVSQLHSSFLPPSDDIPCA